MSAHSREATISSRQGSLSESGLLAGSGCATIIDGRNFGGGVDDAIILDNGGGVITQDGGGPELVGSVEILEDCGVPGPGL